MVHRLKNKGLRRVWPTLLSFPHLLIRYALRYPFGGVYHDLKPIPPDHRRSLPDSNSTYSRIGVLAYNGCSTEQIGRIGDLLQYITSHGGLPSLRSRTTRFKCVQKVHFDLTKTAPKRQVLDMAQWKTILNDLFKDEPGSTRIEEESCQIPKPGTNRKGLGYRKTLAAHVWLEKLGPDQDQTGSEPQSYNVKLYTVGSERYIASARIARTVPPTSETAEYLKTALSAEDDLLTTTNRRREVADRLYALERECFGDEKLRVLNEDAFGPGSKQDRVETGTIKRVESSKEGNQAVVDKEARPKKRTGSYKRNKGEAKAQRTIQGQRKDLPPRHDKDEHSEKLIVDA